MLRSVIWIVERIAFPETAARCIEAVVRAGGDVVEYADGMDERRLPAAGARAVFYGSLGVGQRLTTRGWSPGVICNAERLRCSSYADPLRGLLLNDRVAFTTVSEFVTDPRAVADEIGAQDRVFVRPDSPLKPFAGRVLDVGAVSLRALDHGFYYHDLSLPIVVSLDRPVAREWRFVLVERSVVAASGYVAEGRAVEDGAIPESALALARDVSALDWAPDPAFVVDVCETVEGSWHVLELNSLSCSDLYGCDFDAVVAAIGRLPGPTRAQGPA